VRIFRETLLADDGLPGGWVDVWVTPVTGCPVWIHLISSRVSGDQENLHFFGIVEAVGSWNGGTRPIRCRDADQAESKSLWSKNLDRSPWATAPTPEFRV
jgi:hypothetical protein